MRNAYILLAAALALVIMALVVALSSSSQTTTDSGTDSVGDSFPRPGAAVPDFSATDLQGRVVQLSALRGKPVWINFWATWCPPCKEEMPRMEQQYSAHQAEGLTIIGVNMQESREAVRSWVQDRFHWTFVLDPDLRLANLLEVSGLPGHLFIDRAGIVRTIQIGALDETQMNAALEAIVVP